MPEDSAISNVHFLGESVQPIEAGVMTDAITGTKYRLADLSGTSPTMPGGIPLDSTTERAAPQVSYDRLVAAMVSRGYPLTDAHPGPTGYVCIRSEMLALVLAHMEHHHGKDGAMILNHSLARFLAAPALW
jgi:hypothetical protein